MKPWKKTDRQTDAEAEKLDMVEVCIKTKDEFLKFLLREPRHCVFKSTLETHKDVQEPLLQEKEHS